MVDGNLVEMGKLIGAGLACTGMGGAAIGVGHVVGNFLSGALRNSKCSFRSNSYNVYRYCSAAEALGFLAFCSFTINVCNVIYY